MLHSPAVNDDDNNNGDDDDDKEEENKEEKDTFKVPKLPPKWHTLVEMSQLDWLESVEVVFEYFASTPRSYVEIRETSLLWSYKYSDPDYLDDSKRVICSNPTDWTDIERECRYYPRHEICGKRGGWTFQRRRR